MVPQQRYQISKLDQLNQEMTRSPCCLKTGLKKGPWSSEEDEILIDHIKNHGHSNWRALPIQAGLLRCGKSCRLRWTNYLNPNIKRGNFSEEEEKKIIELHRVLGNRWSAIAGQLSGRTDNEIKNVWHTRLKKRLPADSHFKQPTKTATSSHRSNSVVSSSSSNDTEMYVTKEEEFVKYCGEYKPEIIDESFWSDEQSSETHWDMKFSSHEASVEAESLRAFSSEYTDDDLEFWCNILVETEIGGMMTSTELPEF